MSYKLYTKQRFDELQARYDQLAREKSLAMETVRGLVEKLAVAEDGLDWAVQCLETAHDAGLLGSKEWRSEPKGTISRITGKRSEAEYQENIKPAVEALKKVRTL